MPHQIKALALAAALLAAGRPPAAAAQTSPPTEPPTDPPIQPQEERPDARRNPLLTDPSLDRDVSERTSRPEPGGPLLPTRAPAAAQVVPNQGLDPTRLPLAGSDQWLRADTLIPEGTFLVRRVGEVVRLRTGGLAFVPAAEEDVSLDPAMPLLPCEVYGRLGALLDGADGRLWMAITGEVFEYHGRNYLLPSAFASVGAEPGSPEPDPAPANESPTQPPAAEPEAEADGVAEAEVEAEQEPEAQPEPAPAGDPRIEQLVRELEAERSERRGLDTDYEVETSAGEGTPPGPRIEGKLLLGRRARMVRGEAGGWVLVLDNDADAPADAVSTSPERLYLLPSRLVAEMERHAERRGEAWAFEISGNLFRHGERVYLVPRLYVSLPEEEVDPLQ